MKKTVRNKHRLDSLAEAPRPDEHGAGVAVAEGVLDGRLPGVAGDEVPLVEPGFDLLALQPPGDLLDGRLIGAAMREEDVESDEVGHDSPFGAPSGPPPSAERVARDRVP